MSDPDYNIDWQGKEFDKCCYNFPESVLQLTLARANAVEPMFKNREELINRYGSPANGRENREDRD